MNPETNPLQAMRSVPPPGGAPSRRSTTSYGIASADQAEQLKICLEEKQKIYDENIQLADHAQKLLDENIQLTSNEELKVTKKPGSGGGGKRRTKRRRTKRRRTKRRRTKRRRTKRS